MNNDVLVTSPSLVNFIPLLAAGGVAKGIRTAMTCNVLCDLGPWYFTTRSFVVCFAVRGVAQFRGEHFRRKDGDGLL